MKKLILIPLFILGFFFLVKPSVSAQAVEKEYVRSYVVKEDFMEISESKTLRMTQPNLFISRGNIEQFIIFNPVDGDSEKEEKIQKTLDSIKVTDNNGASIEYSSEVTEKGNLILKVVIPINITFGQQYTINLKYNSFGLAIKGGNLLDVYIPSFAEDYKFQDATTIERIKTTVRIPTSAGEINFISPTVQALVEGDSWLIDFPQEKLVGTTGWIQIGTTQYYRFEINQPYNSTNDISFTNNVYKIIIPRNVNNQVITQKTYFSKISPEPTKIEEDENKNLIAYFSIPSNQSGEIIIEGFGVLDHNTNIDFRNSGKVSEIPEEVKNSSTKAAEYWEVDNAEIQAAAQDIIRDLDLTNATVYEVTSRVYDYVINKIDYSEVKRFGINERQGALATLKGGAAVCMEYSDLFIALMRSLGIPTRAAYGFGYSSLDDADSSDNTINHQWAEVYIPSMDAWIAVDTTWGENAEELIGGDLNHFYTHVASISPNEPATTEVQYYGDNFTIPKKNIFVDAIASFDSTGLSTQEDLLTRYPAQSDEHADSPLLQFLYSIDNRFDSLMTRIFPGVTQSVTNLVKIIISVTTGFLTIIVIIHINRRRKKIKYGLLPPR